MNLLLHTLSERGTIQLKPSRLPKEDVAGYAQEEAASGISSQ